MLAAWEVAAGEEPFSNRHHVFDHARHITEPAVLAIILPTHAYRYLDKQCKLTLLLYLPSIGIHHLTCLPVFI